MKTLAQLEQDAQDLATQIKALKEKEEQAATEPWEPTLPEGTDRHYIAISGDTALTKHDRHEWRRAGRLFKSKEAAYKASTFFTFYQRLYQLALECNEKHPVPSLSFTYGVRLHHNHWCISSQEHGNQYPSQFFISRSAAKEACDIMNRDKWIMPTV